MKEQKELRSKYYLEFLLFLSYLLSITVLVIIIATSIAVIKIIAPAIGTLLAPMNAPVILAESERMFPARANIFPEVAFVVALIRVAFVIFITVIFSATQVRLFAGIARPTHPGFTSVHVLI